MFKTCQPSIVLFFLITLLVVYVFITYNTGMNTFMKTLLISKVHTEQCPGVLSHMMKGSWRVRPLTTDEQKAIDDFLEGVVADFPMSKDLQRDDGLCGNISFKEAKWFRALCNPKGQTPCCFENKCQKKTVEECTCPHCYDLRVRKHAEYSTWVPSHKGCKFKNFTTVEACELLNRSTIHFVGDSLMRHMYTAMLLLLTGNVYDGALNKNIPKAIHDQCTGMNMFTEKVCRNHLMFGKTVCKGHVRVEMRYYWCSGFGEQFKREFIPMIKNPRTWILVGFGIHDGYNVSKVLNKFILPFWKKLSEMKETWPNVIWASTHCPGLLKPIAMAQNKKQVKEFNAKISSALKPYRTPIFDTYNLTHGMTSFDGLHFGLGINLAKAQLFLNYFNEVQTRLKSNNSAWTK